MFEKITTAFKDYSILSKELKSNRTQLKKDFKLCAEAKLTNNKITDLDTQTKIRSDYKKGNSLVNRVEQYNLKFPWLSKVVAALNFIIGNRLLIEKTKKRIEKLEEKSNGVIDLRGEPGLKNAQKGNISHSSVTKSPQDDMELSEENTQSGPKTRSLNSQEEETPKQDTVTSEPDKPDETSSYPQNAEFNPFDSVHNYDLTTAKLLIKEGKKIKEALKEEIKKKLEIITDEDEETNLYLEGIINEIKGLSIEGHTAKLENFDKNIEAIQKYLNLPAEQRTVILFPNRKQRVVARLLLSDHDAFMQTTGLNEILPNT